MSSVNEVNAETRGNPLSSTIRGKGESECGAMGSVASAGGNPHLDPKVLFLGDYSNHHSTLNTRKEHGGRNGIKAAGNGGVKKVDAV